MKQQSSFLKIGRSFVHKNFRREIFRTTRTVLAGALFVFFFGCAARRERYMSPQSEAEKHYILATSYHRESNFSLAIQHWRTSAFQGGVEAQFLLRSLITLERKDLDPKYYTFTLRGVPYETIEKPEPYETIATRWRQKTNLSKEEQFNLGTFLAFYEDHHKFPITAETISLWVNSAKQGYDKAQFAVGYAYDVSEGVPANKAEAAKWYRLAAAQNHPWAQWMLDAMLAEGSVETSSAPPIRSAQVSPQPSRTEADAEYRLGWQYYQAKDYPGALAHYYQAALKDHPAAQYNLALAYANGQGTAKNQKKADYWFQRAAKNGVTGAKPKTSGTPAKTIKAKVEDTSHIPAVSLRDEEFLELCKTGSHKQIVAAIKGGSNPNIRDDGGVPVLTWTAAINPNAEAITALLQSGANVDEKANLKIDSETIRSARKMGVDLSRSEPGEVSRKIFKDDVLQMSITITSNSTALIAAALNNPNVEVIHALLCAGADINAKDNKGETALTMSLKNSNSKVREILLQAGAK